VHVVSFAILVYLEDGRLESTVASFKFCLTLGEKYYRSFKNVESNSWRADNRKNPSS
jgi:hypothetical protein